MANDSLKISDVHKRNIELTTLGGTFTLRDLERLCEAAREAGADGDTRIVPERQGQNETMLSARVDLSPRLAAGGILRRPGDVVEGGRTIGGSGGPTREY